MNCWGAFAVVKLEEYVEIASGDDFNCALNNDGIPTCWGDDQWGQLIPPNMYMTKLQ